MNSNAQTSESDKKARPPRGNNRNRNNNRRRNNNRKPGANRNNPKKHDGDNPRPSNNRRQKRPKVKNEKDSTQNNGAPVAQKKPNVVPMDTSVAEKKSGHITDHKFADLNISSESRRAMAEVFRYEFMTAAQHETLPLILKDKK
eukprot:CAMPEP_0116123418 /NCGR_PEP_ID=MMETSP0329-20121206/4739_1 /TAXON_ID=697910 /ORGANISM="Pseudo-nitzschia arenysensis, Strain B593" /LENGTH=143 /DNA_ID=CAMNT_0003617335 /DNA_START=9 /DNA_END=437 /DNA_ORIENTATION=-